MLSGSTTTFPLLIVSSWVTWATLFNGSCAASVTSMDDAISDLPSVVDVASSGGSGCPGGHTAGSMSQRAVQSMPSATTYISRSPVRTIVTARTTGATAVTPGM